jgi:rhomboid protease GluP
MRLNRNALENGGLSLTLRGCGVGRRLHESALFCDGPFAKGPFTISRGPLARERKEVSSVVMLVEVFRSRRRAECEERAFVLTAVGIPSQVDATAGFDGLQYVLMVDESQHSAASAHLARYALESRPAPPPPPPPPLHPFSWVGATLYALTLLVVGYAVAGGFWRLDSFELGAMDAARVQAGEWWRAWTALTLHVDAGHLVANLGAGIWFGYLAGRQLGPGHAWLLTVVAAGLANLAEALLGPSTHHSVGASTAVFTMLGVLSAYSWRTGYTRRSQRWPMRWGPLIAGALLLGWTGTGGMTGLDRPEVIAASTTDIVAHVAGFVAGVAVGVGAAARAVQPLLHRLPQWVSGGGAVLILAVAWAIALTS